MPAKTGEIRIGISGWTYPPWRGVFYPKGLAQKHELGFASNQFRSIEINGTFYGTQRPKSFQVWAEATPDDFIFSVKAPRFLTHIKRLLDVKTPLANFLASGILALGAKLGPILWQFPPNMKFDAELFENFLSLLPHDSQAAAEAATQYDERLKGKAWTKTDKNRPLRHALEIRHESFRDPEFIKLLHRYKAALVCADTVEWPRLMDITSDFMYCRLHGSEQLYASGYDAKALDGWARCVKAWASGHEPEDAERISGPAKHRAAGRDVFVYFDNDIKVKAPKNARELVSRL